MTEPIRMTDDDVLILRLHGPDSDEGRAALKRLTQQLADWIDERVAEEVYGSLGKSRVMASKVDPPSN